MQETTTTSLPTDQFDLVLARLIGLPNGAHTNVTAQQSQDFYGNVTSYMIQTVRTDSGDTVFMTQVNANGSARFIIPSDVLAIIDRQRASVLTQIRRRHGKRLVEEGKLRPHGFTPEMRAKAIATRKRKAVARRARRSRS